MAYLPAEAIITAVREVCDEASGSLRVIAATKYSTGTHETQGADTKSREAVVKPRFDVRFNSLGKNPASPPNLGNKQIYDVSVQVAVVRHLDIEHRVIASARHDAIALAYQDGDVLQQALTYLNNLEETAAAVATNLASGCLIYEGSQAGEVTLGESGPGMIETVHFFRGIVTVTIQSGGFLDPQTGAPFPNEA